MTREDITALETGWQIDALIAEKVMGHEVKVWHDGSASVRVNNGYDHVRKYSSDMDAAWEVVEKFEEINVKKYETIGSGPRYLCRIEIGECTMYATASTAPLAICQAALLTTLEEE